jgi:formiminoglutamase
MGFAKEIVILGQLDVVQLKEVANLDFNDIDDRFKLSQLVQK